MALLYRESKKSETGDLRKSRYGESRLRSLTQSRSSLLQSRESSAFKLASKHLIQPKQDERRKVLSKFAARKDSGRYSVIPNSKDRETMFFVRHNNSVVEPSTSKKKICN